MSSTGPDTASGRRSGPGGEVVEDLGWSAAGARPERRPPPEPRAARSRRGLCRAQAPWPESAARRRTAAPMRSGYWACSPRLSPTSVRSPVRRGVGKHAESGAMCGASHTGAAGSPWDHRCGSRPGLHRKAQVKMVRPLRDKPGSTFRHTDARRSPHAKAPLPRGCALGGGVTRPGRHPLCRPPSRQAGRGTACRSCRGSGFRCSASCRRSSPGARASGWRRRRRGPLPAPR